MIRYRRDAPRRRPKFYRYPGVVPAKLSWAPPSTSTTIHVTNASNRILVLDDATDYRIVFDEVINTGSGQGDGGLFITGGRNLVIIGGQIAIPQRAMSCQLTAQLNISDTTINVNSTTGLDASGAVKLRGYSWTYTGKTSTTLTGASGESTSIAGQTGVSPAPHPNGTPVYPHERARMGLYLISQRGTIHIEGLLIDGADMTEGIQVYGAAGASLQIQNCKTGPATARDLTNFTDNHPDSLVQMLNGLDAVRIDRCHTITTYQGLLGLGSVIPVGSWDIRHSFFEGVDDAANNLPRGHLINDQDVTNVALTNVWSYPTPRRPDLRFIRGTESWGPLAELVQFGSPPAPFATTAGASYVSPGYG